ncbi:MAG TPA: DUF2442 domain-containing protein [Thermomicrobiales bacterium]|nr:DUF2442 domain-containing protein [Thermomicrobiales bacterium]
MSSTSPNAGAAMATDVTFDAERLHVALSDGRRISVPLAWVPRLAGATEAQRHHWELIGRGIGIHWPEVDEDLSVAGLLLGNRPGH